MTAVATYLYCLVASARAPRLSGAPRGLPSTKRLRALDAGGGLWIVAADAPLERYGEAALAAGLKDLDWVSRCALGHERVIEHFLSAPAVVPMKLFTLFRDDERAVRHVARDRKRLDRVIRRIEGRLEWGARVTFAATGAGEVARAERPRTASGTAFLLGKKRARDAAREQMAIAVDAAAHVHAALGALADDTRRRDPEDDPIPGRLLLDAAYLVSRAAAPAFRNRARALARSLAPRGARVVVNGPWPAYHFVDEGA
jgi:hypothetical protein